MGLSRNDCPPGIPGLSKEQFTDTSLRFTVRLQWQRFLVRQQPNWQQARAIAERFKTSLPPPHNPWFLDLPIEWVPELIDILKQSIIEGEKNDRCLRIKDGVVGWDAKIMLDMLPPELSIDDIKDTPGPKFAVDDFIFDQNFSALWTLKQHGLAKGAALILGLAHHHDGNDLIITSGWSALMEAFGFSTQEDKPMLIVDSRKIFTDKIAKMVEAEAILSKEEELSLIHI